jgi:large subunit ribosomal protein L31
MKTGIHPKYDYLEAICSCGNVVKTKSTKPGTIRLDVCSNCHSFYTGTQKKADVGGRIDKFNKKFNRSPKAKEE